MKSKLSALKFVKNNKKQVRVMVAALSLTFMTMYMVCFILFSTEESFKSLCLEQPKKVAYMELTPDTLGVDKDSYAGDDEYNQAIDLARDKVMEDLRGHEGISGAFLTQTLSARYSGIVGSMSYDFPLLDKEQIPEFLDHMDAKLTSGRMPEKDGEILVDKKVLKNDKMKVGSYFRESAFGDIFTVVGEIESDYMTCVGTPCGYTNTGWYIVVLCDEENSDMTKVLGDIGIVPTEYDRIYDLVDWSDEVYDKMVVEQLDAAMGAILVVVIIFLAISILIAYVTFMRNRVNEYCLYASIGFARKDIYGMVMREILIIFGAGIILGALVTVLMMYVFGVLVIEPMGLLYKYFYPKQLLRIIAAFAAIVGFLQIPISVTLNNIKTMDLIEE